MRIAARAGFAVAFLVLCPVLLVLTAVSSKSQSDIPFDDLSYRLSFESDSGELSDAGRTEAKAFAARLSAIPGLRLVLTGFAAQTGNRLYDRHLALARARALRQALVDAGFPKGRTVLEAEVVAPGAGEMEAGAAPDGPLSPHRAEVRPYAP